MKIFLLTLIQLLSSIILFGQSYKYTSTNLNLRSGPGTSYEIVATIPSGTSVKMAENCDCEWIRVYFSGKIGYVNSKYLLSQERQNATTHKSNQSSVNSYRTTQPGSNYNSQNTSTQTKSNYNNNSAAGATALCNDGTYSYSQNRRGTCSHHGGVARWLR